MIQQKKLFAEIKFRIANRKINLERYQKVLREDFDHLVKLNGVGEIRELGIFLYAVSNTNEELSKLVRKSHSELNFKRIVFLDEECEEDYLYVLRAISSLRTKNPISMVA